jgi:protocatechuate 3,4-dioxygenase beta subunit
MFQLFRALLARLDVTPRSAKLHRHSRAAARRRTFWPQLELLEDRRTPAGSISGHVFVDATGNGLSADDAPGRHVIVELFKDSDHSGTLDRHDHLVGLTVTRADGSYSFRHLGPGTYFVVERTPHGSVRTAPAVSSDYVVDLGRNQNVTGLDFDNFKRPSTGVVKNLSFTITHPDGSQVTVTDLRGQTHIGDTVTANFTVAGHAKAVVVSFAVYTTAGPTFDPATAAQDAVVQDATGTFGPGAHSLTIQVPNDFYEVDLVVGAAIDQFGPAGSNIFYTPQGRLLSADNGGSKQTEQPASLFGVVTDNFGSPITVVPVTLALSGTTDTNQSVFVTITAAPDGSYSFTGLAPGTYSITATAPGYQGLSATAGSLSGTVGISTVSDITAGSGANGTGYNFVLQMGGGVSS